MKKRPAMLCALLLAGILCAGALLFAGCSSEIRVEATGTASGTAWKTLPPWLLQYAPLIQSSVPLPEDLPNGSYPEISQDDYTPPPITGSVTLPPVTHTVPGTGVNQPPSISPSDPMRVLLSHSSENAANRASDQGWELLDGYIVPPAGVDAAAYRALFSPDNTHPTTLFNSQNGRIWVTFDRSVEVCGIELVFGDTCFSSDFRMSFNGIDMDMTKHRDCFQKEVYEKHGFVSLDNSTVWLESTSDLPIYTNISSDWVVAYANGSSLYIDLSYGSSYTPLLQINLYGRSYPEIDDSQIPVHLPDGWSYDLSYGPGRLMADYYNEYGEYVGGLIKYAPAAFSGIPEGITREFTMGSISATQLIHPKTRELLDFYWSDGSYFYNLSGTHPDLLQLVFLCMG